MYPLTWNSITSITIMRRGGGSRSDTETHLQSILAYTMTLIPIRRVRLRPSHSLVSTIFWRFHHFLVAKLYITFLSCAAYHRIFIAAYLVGRKNSRDFCTQAFLLIYQTKVLQMTTQILSNNPSLNTQSSNKGLLVVWDFCFWVVWAARPVH